MHRIRAIRNIKLGIKTLMLHKLRSLLTMLGVVCGVGSVIGMLAVGEGASKEAIESLRRLGSTNIMIHSMKPVEEEQSTQRVPVSIYGLLYEDLQRIIETFDAVERAVPAKLIRKQGSLGDRTLELRLVGTTAAWFDLVRREVIAGRTLDESDVNNKRPACVLTEAGARKLLAGSNTIGQPIKIGADIFEVVGIVKSEFWQGGSIQTPDSEVDAYVPITTARERFGDFFVKRSSGSSTSELVELHQIIVEVKSTEYVESVAKSITTMLQRFHKKVDYQVRVPLAQLKETEATKRRFNLVLGSIAGISLLVGGIGIMNIMLASVTERTREIGLRRAIGAKKRQIVGQFLIETVVLSTCGGLIGIVAGIGLPWLIEYFLHTPTEVPMYSIILSLGISMTVGIVFGIYPAMRAANLDPIVALRNE